MGYWVEPTLLRLRFGTEKQQWKRFLVYYLNYVVAALFLFTAILSFWLWSKTKTLYQPLSTLLGTVYISLFFEIITMALYIFSKVIGSGSLMKWWLIVFYIVILATRISGLLVRFSFTKWLR